jgi:hypothetical protein
MTAATGKIVEADEFQPGALGTQGASKGGACEAANTGEEDFHVKISGRGCI